MVDGTAPSDNVEVNLDSTSTNDRQLLTLRYVTFTSVQGALESFSDFCQWSAHSGASRREADRPSLDDSVSSRLLCSARYEPSSNVVAILRMV